MRVLWLVGMMVLFLAGCGEDADPTRPNEFVPLTAIRIVPPYPTLAKQTAGQFKAFGNYSSVFEREITDRVSWQSDVNTVLAFDAARPGWGVAGQPGTASITASLDNLTGALPFTVTNATIGVIDLQPAEISRPVGLTQQFSAEGGFSDQTRQDLTTQVAWLSSNPELVSIDSNGLAQTLAVGAANTPVVITATFAGVSAQAQLTVSSAELQSLRVTAPNVTLLVGETQQFTATATYSDNTSADLTTHADIAWTSTVPAIATVGSKTGMVTAVASGSANITATFGGVSGSTPVQVVLPETITVTPANSTMARGQTQQLTATATFGSGEPRDVTGLVAWLSTETAVATVDSSGLVRSFQAGATTIRASVQSIVGETRVTVLP